MEAWRAAGACLEQAKQSRDEKRGIKPPGGAESPGGDWPGAASSTGDVGSASEVAVWEEGSAAWSLNRSKD